MKSLFYIIICTAALAFNSCECFSDSVKTEVTSFTTNQHTQFITNHECYGFKYALAKNQADCSWFSFKVDVDSVNVNNKQNNEDFFDDFFGTEDE